jgi:hypothetical protein
MKGWNRYSNPRFVTSADSGMRPSLVRGLVNARQRTYVTANQQEELCL